MAAVALLNETISAKDTLGIEIQAEKAIITVFTSDAEKPIVKRFSGRLDALKDASRKLYGEPCGIDLAYDISIVFEVLPKISILLLFNDRDQKFPAACSMLIQRQAEDYLDPESLIMTGIALTQRLLKLSI